MEKASARFLQLLCGSFRGSSHTYEGLGLWRGGGTQSVIQCVRIRGATAHIEEPRHIGAGKKIAEGLCQGGDLISAAQRDGSEGR